MTRYPQYAVNLDLTDRAVLVVGGGPVGSRKAAGLLRAGAAVTVVAPQVVAEIADDPDIQWFTRAYERGEVASYWLGVTATNNPAVNAQVAKDGRQANVFVNSADDPANCSFTLPAVARRGDVQLAISTNGRSPALARWLRRRYEREISAGLVPLLDLLAEVRSETQEVHGTSEIPGWGTALDDGLLDLVAAGQVESARQRLRHHLRIDHATNHAEPLEQIS